MRLSMKANEDEVFADIDRFTARVHAIAVPRALNRLIDQAQVAGLREINNVYKIGPRTMERYVTTKLATTTKLEASITARGKGFPLYAFSPRQTRNGVSVLIKGRRVIIPHAFIATMPNGHTGVFARGAYGGKGKRFKASGAAFGRFQFSRSRLSINELYTLSPPDALANADVTTAMEDRVAEQMPKVLAQEIRFLRSQSFG